jgi:hypothetical protein
MDRIIKRALRMIRPVEIKDNTTSMVQPMTPALFMAILLIGG